LKEAVAGMEGPRWREFKKSWWSMVERSSSVNSALPWPSAISTLSGETGKVQNKPFLGFPGLMSTI
jgi:hypothetical protein